MRLAAYEDSIYQRDGDVLTARRAFPVFLAALSEHVELTLLGRVDPAPGRAHHEVPGDFRFVALPFYGALTQPLAVARALAVTLARFWRELGRVDAIWLLGPHPFAFPVALMALARRRRIFLGVRQNTMEYARMRHPGSKPAQLVFKAMELAWRALARIAPVAVVGPELAQLYRGSRDVLEVSISFVSASDIVDPVRRAHDGPVQVVTVGRLDPEKNPVMLADVLAALPQDWRLTVVGEGPLGDELRARLEALGVADRADLRGYVPVGPQLFDVYRSADLFLHVSWTEGVPQVLFEAMAARLPIAATDVGGVRAAVEGCALLVEAGDAAAAAAALQRLADEPDLRGRLVEAGVERVRTRTLEAQVGRIADWMKRAA